MSALEVKSTRCSDATALIASADPKARGSVVALAYALLGRDAIEMLDDAEAETLLIGNAKMTNYGRWRIVLRKSASAAERVRSIAWGLAAWWYRNDRDTRFDDENELADALLAATRTGTYATAPNVVDLGTFRAARDLGRA